VLQAADYWLMSCPVFVAANLPDALQQHWRGTSPLKLGCAALVAAAQQVLCSTQCHSSCGSEQRSGQRIGQRERTAAGSSASPGDSLAAAAHRLAAAARCTPLLLRQLHQLQEALGLPQTAYDALAAAACDGDAAQLFGYAALVIRDALLLVAARGTHNHLAYTPAPPSELSATQLRQLRQCLPPLLLLLMGTADALAGRPRGNVWLHSGIEAVAAGLTALHVISRVPGHSTSTCSAACSTSGSSNSGSGGSGSDSDSAIAPAPADEPHALLAPLLRLWCHMFMQCMMQTGTLGPGDGGSGSNTGGTCPYCGSSSSSSSGGTRSGADDAPVAAVLTDLQSMLYAFARVDDDCCDMQAALHEVGPRRVLLLEVYARRVLPCAPSAEARQRASDHISGSSGGGSKSATGGGGGSGSGSSGSGPCGDVQPCAEAGCPHCGTWQLQVFTDVVTALLLHGSPDREYDDTPEPGLLARAALSSSDGLLSVRLCGLLVSTSKLLGRHQQHGETALMLASLCQPVAALARRAPGCVAVPWRAVLARHITHLAMHAELAAQSADTALAELAAAEGGSGRSGPGSSSSRGSQRAEHAQVWHAAHVMLEYCRGQWAAQEALILLLLLPVAEKHDQQHSSDASSSSSGSSSSRSSGSGSSSTLECVDHVAAHRSELIAAIDASQSALRLAQVAVHAVLVQVGAAGAAPSLDVHGIKQSASLAYEAAPAEEKAVMRQIRRASSASQALALALTPKSGLHIVHGALVSADKLIAAQPSPLMCNYHSCTSLAQGSELRLVGGRGTVCGGCRVARHCCADHQAFHWPEHQLVCRRLSSSGSGATQRHAAVATSGG
jgi:hypothetical protein